MDFTEPFYDIDLSSSQCPNPDEIPKINSDFSGVECSSDFQVDSFFDVFYQIERDTQTNTDNVGQIQTELVALDLRGQSCNVGDVVTGIGADGQIICAPDQLGGLGDIQSKIDDKNAQIADLESQIAQKESDLEDLQNQLDDLALPQEEILQCQQQCAAQNAVAQIQLQQCVAAAISQGLEPTVECADEQAAVDNPCTCPTTSNPELAAQLEEQIATLTAELATLNQQLEDCQFELIVLQVLASINDPCQAGSASGTGNLPEECTEPTADIDLG